MIEFVIGLAIGTVAALIAMFLLSVLVMLTVKAVAFAYEKIFGKPLE